MQTRVRGVTIVLVFLVASLSLSPVTAALRVTNNFLRLTITGGPDGNEKIAWDATIAVVTTDPTNPATSEPDKEEISVSIQYWQTDTSVPGGGRFVESYSKRLPPGSLATADGGQTYTLTQLGRDQGLDTFNLIRTANGYSSEYLDKQATLPQADYTTTVVSITIGDDPGSGSSTLQPNGNIWTITS